MEKPLPGPSDQPPSGTQPRVGRSTSAPTVTRTRESGSTPPTESGGVALGRVQIEGVAPELDGGRFPVKRVIGDDLVVEADLFADGHDQIAAVLRYRPAGEAKWQETPMEPLPNDRWRASLPLEGLGRYQYSVAGWIDPFRTWRREFEKWVEAGDQVLMELRVGAELVEAAAERAEVSPGGLAPGDGELPNDPATQLRRWATRLRTWSADPSLEDDPSSLLGPDGPTKGELAALMARFPDRTGETRYGRELEVVVDRERARFSAWYEFFPRSTAPDSSEHGTFDDARRMLPYVREMGFDVVYLPPIHPVGRTNRKGPNNRRTAEAGDPGSPWAIGAKEGGHKSVDPRLGTLEDFRRFRAAAEAEGLEVALDIAYQCSPDHPYVEDHPEWFRTRPDGTIRYAENPPKKYEDIYPIDFETDRWPELWQELKSVFSFWADEGVRIFRVDNPHTKALPFWEWTIRELKETHPDLIFLSEAFTRPKMMYRLAKLGFTQSYTYFAWRNTKAELTSYLEELVQPPLSEHFRPNFWPNTPDILTEFLQTGGRPAFMLRLVLAATLSSNYGIYGPAFELLEAAPREPGSEEYLNSEKYELREWELDREDSLRDFIARVNRIRRENEAFHTNDTLSFHAVDNALILAYTKRPSGGGASILTVVNLDPHHVQSGWVDLDPDTVGISGNEAFQVHDLLGGGHYFWEGTRNFVQLDPHVSPAQIFQVVTQGRSERDFDPFA